MISTPSPDGTPQWDMLGIVAALARVSLGALFAYAALTKLADPARLADDIANYRMLPAHFVPWLAAVLPGIELVTGLLLIAGVSTRAAASLAATMLAIFMVAVGQALARGLDIDCGCFGGEASADVSAIARNLLLGTIAVFVAAADRGVWSLGGQGPQDDGRNAT